LVVIMTFEMKNSGYEDNIKLDFREIGCNYDVWTEEEWIRG